MGWTLTRCDSQQLLLDLVDERADFGGRTSPEDETVSRVGVGWIFQGAVELAEVGVEDPAGKVWREDLGFLLGVAGEAMGFVAGLDLGLTIWLKGR